MSAMGTMVHIDNCGGGADNGALALSCSLLAHVMAAITAAWMTVCNNNSGRAEDGALPALSATPCAIMHQQQQQLHR